MPFSPFHTYEVRGAKIVIALARNKCRACQKAIPKGNKYLLVFLYDTCHHNIGGRYVGLHKRIKLCRACRDNAFHPKVPDGRIVAEETYENRLRAAIKEMGISRYEMALKGG